MIPFYLSLLYPIVITDFTFAVLPLTLTATTPLLPETIGDITLLQPITTTNL